MLCFQVICLLLFVTLAKAVFFQWPNPIFHRRTTTTTTTVATTTKRVDIVPKVNYCHLKCGKEEHFACNNNGKPGPDCPANVKNVYLDASMHNLILSLHNEMRNDVAGGHLNHLPPAGRMAHMAWDIELAYTAKLKAFNCSSDYDHCRSTEKFESPGQNLAWLQYETETEKFTLKQLVQNRIKDWFKTSANTSAEQIFKFHEKHAAHQIKSFATAVIDKNTHIGCGAVHYEIKPKSYFHLVCNYAHKLKVGQPVYKTGAPASECTAGKDHKYKNLCLTSEKYV